MNFGVHNNGVGSLQIRSGSTMTFKALAASDATTFDVTGNIDADGSNGTGGALILNGGDAASGTAGDAVTLATVTGTTKLATLTIQGGDANQNDAGGAVTQTNFNGNTTVTTYNVLGGDGLSLIHI